MVDQYTPDPDNFPIIVQLFDDGSPPNSSQFNPAYEGSLDRTASNRGFLGSLMAGNWYAANSPGGAGVNNASYAWDPLGVRWCAALNEGGTDVLQTSVDCGRTWNFLHNLSNTPTAISTTQQVGYVLVYEALGGGIVVDRIDISGAFATGAAFGAANVNGITPDYFHNQVIAGAANLADTNLFCFVQTGGNFVGHWYVGANANGYLGGANWTDESAQLPAAFAGGANHVGQFLVANTTGGQRAAIAGDIEVVALCGVTPGTDTPHLMKIVSNVPAAATITDITANLPAPGPTFVIAGLAYDTVNQLWGLALQTNVAGLFVYSSPDLITWTQVHQFAQFSGGCGGLAIAGGTWAVWVGASNLAVADPANRVVYSWNVLKKGAASTWMPAAMTLPVFGPGSATPGVLLSNGQQLLAGQVASASSLAKAQVSWWAGLGPGSGVF